MPRSTVLEMPPEEQAQLLAVLRRARYGDLLSVQIVRLCAAGGTPTAIAAVLFCSRSRVYRTVRAYRTGTVGWEADEAGALAAPVRPTVLLPTLQRSLRALLKVSPPAYGWCRTRWSCAPLAMTRQTKRGITVSAETMRRWLHELGWVWKRAKPMAKDVDPGRVARLAQIRWVFEQLQPTEALVFADELAVPLWPKVGCAWMSTGTHVEVMTPGQHQKHDVAGALDLATGTRHHGLGPRKTHALFRDLLGVLAVQYPAECSTHLSVVVDTYKSHKAKAVEPWLAAHPRVTLRLLPTDGPRANPIERAFGDVHDGGTRNHQRKRLPDLVAEVETHLQVNGPWPYKLAHIYYEPMVTVAVEKLVAESQPKAVA